MQVSFDKFHHKKNIRTAVPPTKVSTFLEYRSALYFHSSEKIFTGAPEILPTRLTVKLFNL